MSKQVSLLQEPYNKWTAGSFSYQVNKMDLNGPPDETDMNEAANSTFYPTRTSSQPRIHGDFITRLPNEILLIICGHILKTYTPAFVQFMRPPTGQTSSDPDKASLSRLSRTCTTLRNFVQPLIYRCINTIRYQEQSPCTCSKGGRYTCDLHWRKSRDYSFVCLLRTVTENSYLRDLVRIVELPLDDRDFEQLGWHGLHSGDCREVTFRTCSTFRDLMKNLGVKAFPEAATSLSGLLSTLLLLALPNLVKVRLNSLYGTGLLSHGDIHSLGHGVTEVQLIGQNSTKARLAQLTEMELSGWSSNFNIHLLAPEISPGLRALRLRVMTRVTDLRSVDLTRITSLALLNVYPVLLNDLDRVIKMFPNLRHFNMSLGPKLGSSNCNRQFACHLLQLASPIYAKLEGLVLGAAPYPRGPDLELVRQPTPPLGTLLGRFTQLRSLGIWSRNIGLDTSDSNALVDLIKDCPQLEMLRLFVNWREDCSRILEALRTLHRHKAHGWLNRPFRNVALIFWNPLADKHRTDLEALVPIFKSCDIELCVIADRVPGMAFYEELAQPLIPTRYPLPPGYENMLEYEMREESCCLLEDWS